MRINRLLLLLVFVITSCIFYQKDSSRDNVVNQVTNIQNNRIFQTSFESISDFSGFYIVPQGDYDSNHELSTEKSISGNYSHKAWVVAPRAETNDGVIYLPHRAYPTIQLYKSPMGSFVTPCIIAFNAYLDIALQDRPSGQIDDWFSFATLSTDKSDNWARTILVNITPDSLLRLVHVPDQGKQEYIYQNTSVKYPYREWVRISIYIDLPKEGGYAKVFQNGLLVSHAKVNGGNGLIEQVHFGLYASAAISSGVILNENLVIREVKDETEALKYVN